jgi:phage I-like protein
MANDIEQYRAYAYNDRIVQLRQIVTLVDDGVSAWIQVAPFGRWEGHPTGPFTIDDKTADQIIANYDKQESDAMIDYEHDSLDDTKSGPKLAAGWVKQLEKRKDGIWALVEFVKRAVDYIKAGEIKYVSPAIDFKAKDRKTNKKIGPELINIALTNMPFLDGMQPITLKRLPMGDTIKTTESKTVEKPAQLELNEDVRLQDEETAVDANAAIEALATASGLDPNAVIAALLDKQEEVAAVLTGAEEQEGSEAETEASDPAPEAIAASEKFDEIKNQQIATLSREVESLRNKVADREKADIEDKVSKMIDEGYVLPDQKESAIWAFTTDPDKAAKLFSTKQVPINVEQAKNPTPKDGVYRMSDLTSEEQDYAKCIRAMGVLSEEAAIKKVVAERSN